MKQHRTEFKYSRPVEQMGIAIVYGGIPEIFRMMDNDDLEKAVKKVTSKVTNDEWDLIHHPNESGCGGHFVLIWWEKNG